ncbi:MAG TPA: glycosyltransferase [Thermodesulfobacteriota bacterium]|nr:glycosyltransferase [Thermodesulfobacteriota bacterium]
MPGIDPFSIVNREMSERETKERLDHYHFPTDLPLVVQISRFDRWKDPQGVIEAFKLARRHADCTLVLLGDVATDDPEGPEVYDSLRDSREERIIILSQQDTALVNALQRTAAVVLQKSLREGFGLTVTEAMWKGAAVIGGNVGGIRRQIQDGVNGFLVSSIKETAERIVQLVKDKKLRLQLGQRAKKTVKKQFLLTRYMERYLDLFNSFEAVYRLKKKS